MGAAGGRRDGRSWPRTPASATAQECCTVAPYSFTVDASPGEYTLVVHDEDMSDGEGFTPFQDTKALTVTR